MKLILTIIASLMFNASYAAEKYEKNGYPCMSDICLGDDLSALQKIKWEPTKISKFESKEKLLKKIKKTYKGSDEDLAKAAPYISRGFDNEGLKYLQSVKVACEMDAVGGKFTTENGNKTHVVLMLMGPPTKQKWKVTMIKREFEGVVTEAQKKEIKDTLIKRYAKFDPALASKSKTKPKGIMVMVPFGKTSVQFNLIEGLSSDNELKSDPECGGAKKISID